MGPTAGKSARLKPLFLAPKERGDARGGERRGASVRRTPPAPLPLSLSASHPSPPSFLLMEPQAADSGASPAAAPVQKERESIFGQVDPFLIEALENPRHRLTGWFSQFLFYVAILRMVGGLSALGFVLMGI